MKEKQLTLKTTAKDNKKVVENPNKSKNTSCSFCNKDVCLWFSVGLLICIGVVASYLFKDIALSLRFSAWIVLVSAILLIAFQTKTGKTVWAFALDARIELRKIVWPSKDETIKTTMIIAGLVFIMALILWGVDSLLLWIVNLLTGTQG